MNNHALKLLQTIMQFCDDYKNRKINLSTLQSWVEAVRANFEADIPVKIQDEVFNFVEALERIRFLHSSEEHFDLTLSEINKLMTALEPYFVIS